MRKLSYSLVFTFCLLALSVGVAVYQQHVALADTAIIQNASGGSSLSGITFPVAELGNCTSRDECRAYCDQTEHMDACTAFAKAHGLVTNDEATKSQKFSEILKSGGGPGNCATPQACREFCSTIENMPACVSFAKEHGFNDDNIAEVEKIQQHVQGGGTLPGGCTSKDSCEEYCSDFSHAVECQAFAQKVGITEISNREQEKIPSGQFQKLLELIKEHKTPGQCTSAGTCEEYCQDQAHKDECVAFAKDAGFVSSDQADKIKSLGGKGPGGCDSEDSCKAYCNDTAHQNECLQFGKDHGLVSPEQLKDSHEGLVRIREGITQAPPVVQQCLSSNLGEQTVQDIEAGNLAPSPMVGKQIRSCFENFKENEDPSEPLKHLQSDVATCVKEKVGDTLQKIQQGETAPTSDVADAMRACAQLQTINNDEGTNAQDLKENVQRALHTAPPAVRNCLRTHEDELSGESDTGKIKSVAQECFRDSKSDSSNSSSPSSGQMPPESSSNNEQRKEQLFPRILHELKQEPSSPQMMHEQEMPPSAPQAPSASQNTEEQH